MSKETKTPAVVVGLCAHGLAIARSLTAHGVPVFGFESNKKLPGTSTNKANVVICNAISGTDLIRTLVSQSAIRFAGIKPVLFLTNDDMVRTVSRHWEEVSQFYALSWAHCRANIAELLDKRGLESRCNVTGLNYPATVIVEDAASIKSSHDFAFPILVKPANPMGKFKAELVTDRTQLIGLIQRYESSLPFLAQEWIAGGDDRLKVCAMYLDNGKIIAHFEGRKLASQPPGRGQTSVLQPQVDVEILNATTKFFADLGLSGPVSLELKEDDHGELHVIEPTVGRTDYFLDGCIKNSVNLPAIEYDLVVGAPRQVSKWQRERYIWFDTERDFSSIFRSLKLVLGYRAQYRPIFPYLDRQDWGPFAKAVGSRIRFLVRRLILGRRVYGSNIRAEDSPTRNS